MVKLTGPCFSLEASGTLGDQITYQKSLKSRTARIKPIPTYSRTAGQDAVRDAVKFGVAQWHELLANQQGLWGYYINPDNNSGYHAFMQQFIARTLAVVFQYQLPPNIGYCLVGEHLTGEVITGGVWLDPNA